MIHYKKSFFPPAKFAFMVSGGNDSISAAHLLARKGFNFVVLHANQQFIEQDNIAAAKVEAFCKDFNLKFAILDAKQEYKGGSKEDFCRKARFDAVREWASTNNIRYVGTAQHLNDCVESYLMNTLWGKPDYCPIPPTCFYPECFIFRPFLLTTRKELEVYAKRNKIENYIIQDELNKDNSLMRNWARNELIPKIDERYKGLEKVVRKLMKKFVDERLNFGYRSV